MGIDLLASVGLRKDNHPCWAERFLVLVGQAIRCAMLASLGAGFGLSDGTLSMLDEVPVFRSSTAGIPA